MKSLLSSQIIYRKILKSEFELVYELAQPHFSAFFNWNQEKLNQELNQHQAYGAFNVGQLVAFVILAKKNDNIFEIPVLATYRHQQKTGLMEGLIAWLFASLPPGSEIWLEAHEANVNACNLYKKLGFQNVGLRKNYYQDGGAAQLFTKNL